MTSSPRILAVLLALALAAMSSLVLAQTEDEEKKQDEPTEASIEALKESTAAFGKAISAKSDTDIVYYAKQIIERFAGGDERTQIQSIDTLARGLKTKNDDTRTVIVECLGKSGPRAAKHLLAEAKKSKKDITHLCACLKAAGAVHDEKSYDDILGYLNNKENAVISSAIVAMTGYKDSPTAIRQGIVKELLKTYSSVASAGTKSNPATSDKEKYEFLFNPFESTLKSLTKNNDLQGAEVWSNWFRKEGEDMKEW